jgi:O-antigen/teichoic acid export membrane protein
MRLIRHTGFNLVGGVVPLLVALVSIPLVIRGFGVERFAILSLAWALVGYAGLFDFGLGRATTRFMAQARGAGDRRRVAAVFRVSLAMNLVFGLLGAAVAALVTPWVVHSVLQVPAALQEQTVRMGMWLAAAVPVVTVSLSLVGALESYGLFGPLNLVQATAGSALRLAPLFVMPFTIRVDIALVAIVIVRVLALVAYAALCVRRIPDLREWTPAEPDVARSLLGFGGWLTVSSIVGPLMTYMDRFVIVSVVSLRAVAFYTTPYDAVKQLQLLPFSLARSLFPMFGAATESSGPDLAKVYERSLRVLVILMMLPIIILVALARDLLTLWVGAEFATHSTLVLQVLAIGSVINALAKPPYALIQGLGRSDLTAKLHLLEFGCYVLMLWVFLTRLGIVGAAIAWTLRVALDTVLLRVWATRLMPALRDRSGSDRLRRAEAAATVITVAAFAVPWIHSLPLRVASAMVMCGGFSLLAWRELLESHERLYVTGWVARRRNREFARG